MKTIIVDLFISRDEWMKIYRGETNLVYAKSRDGLSIHPDVGSVRVYGLRTHAD